MRVLVTGGRGFVGTRLVARLAERGDEVVATDREVDVTRPEAVTAAVARARPEAVAHLAAVTFVPDSYADPELAFRVNTLGTLNLLRAVSAEAPRARVLLVGSGAIYGSTKPGAPAFDESAPLVPGSPYAWTKAAADRLGAVFARRGLDMVRVRPFNHTGPGRPESFAESSFARQIAQFESEPDRGGAIRVGNLEAVRDFLDVDDVVDAYLALLNPSVPAGLYNVASGRGRRLREVLDALVAESTVQPQIVEDTARWRPADAGVGNADRLRAATGWEPQRPLELTLARLLAHWRSRLAAS